MSGSDEIVRTLFTELEERGDVLHASYGGIIGLVIAVMRRQHSLSQNQLAQKSGVSHSAISRLELGDAEVTTYQLFKIAEALLVTPGFILGVADKFHEALKKKNIPVAAKAADISIEKLATTSAIVAAGAALGGPVGLLLGAAVGAIIRHYAKIEKDNP